VPVFIALFVTDHTNAAVALYGTAAWTDFFDGYIARKTGAVTELGKLLDPLADRVFIVALCIALLATDVIAWPLALVIVARDIAVLAAFAVLARRGIGTIPVSGTGKSATAALLFGLTWFAWGETTFPGASIGHALGLAFTSLGAVLYWAAAVLYAREARMRLRASEGAA
jgi:cardiolipin synthase